jgi:hypothetical protein
MANLPVHGSGSFVVDWDGAQTLPEHDTNLGKATFDFGRPSASAPVRITVAADCAFPDADYATF